MTLERSSRALGAGLALLAASACSGVPETSEGSGAIAAEETVGSNSQALTGCSLANAVPLRGPNISNRVGSNACVAVISPLLPSWWQYTDGTARVQVAGFDDGDPETPFPLPVQWENTCGTESGSVTYTQSWQQHDLGHASSQCSIVIQLGGPSTEDVVVYWGA